MIFLSYNYPGEEEFSRSQHQQNHPRGFQAVPVQAEITRKWTSKQLDYIFSGNSTKEANRYIMQTTHSFPIQSIIMQYNMTQYNILQSMQHNKIFTIMIILSYNYTGEEEFQQIPALAKPSQRIPSRTSPGRNNQKMGINK